MALDWLKNRLTRAKRETPRWAELADALEEFWETHFDGEYAKALSLRSIYTASNEDQQRMLADFGEHYRDIDSDNRAIAFAMRKLELQQKETTLIISNYIQRHGIYGVQWVPLYAIKAEVYGTRFLSADELTALAIDPNGLTVFLTSRGKISCNLAAVQKTEAFAEIGAFVKTVKPLHIVFDGVWSNLDFDITLTPSATYAATIDKEMTAPFPWIGRQVDGTWKVSAASPIKLTASIQVFLEITNVP